MVQAARFPNLVERAYRLLADCGGVADEAALCRALFGSESAGAWSSLLRSVLGADPRFERHPGGWGLRGPAHPPSLREGEFVALAVQADGPLPWRHRLVAVAALRVAGGRVVERWEALVRPERRRLPAYLATRGIHAEELDAARPFRALAPELLQVLGDAPLVGADAGVAVAFLQYELRRVGLPALANPCCELGALADLLLGEPARAGKPSLARLGALLGVVVADERTVPGRVEAAAACGSALLERALAAGYSEWPELLRVCAMGSLAGPGRADRALLARPLLDRAAAAALPEGPGVYLLRGASGEVLYVGKASDLPRRVAAYCGGEPARARPMPGLVSATAVVEAEPLATELEACLLEARLIARLRPRFNVQRRSGPALAYLGVDTTGPRPRLRLLPFPAPAAVGPFLRPQGRRLATEGRLRFPLRGERGERGARRLATLTARQEALLTWLQGAAARTPLAPDLAAADARRFAVLHAAPGGARAAVVGEQGWQGSIGLNDDPAAMEDEVARALAAPPQPTGLQELGAALAWLRRHRGEYRIVPLADLTVEEATARLREAAQRRSDLTPGPSPANLSPSPSPANLSPSPSPKGEGSRA